MKILLTADVLGGVWTYAITLCRALERHGVDVVLATMGGALSPAQRLDVRRCRRVTLRESHHRLEWMPDAWEDVAAAGDWLLALERETMPDLVHLNGYAHARLPWRVPVLVVGHSCVLSWWRGVHGKDAPAEWGRYRAEATAGLQAAGAVVAPTRTMLDALADHYGPPARGLVIANGCEQHGLPLGARGAFGRYARHADLPEPIVLAAGRVWDESKNYGVLETAAPHTRWAVYVAGSNTLEAREPRALQGVHCLGPLAPSVLGHWLRRASVFVHPAVYEPFGLAPLEAAVAGCALVLGDIPSLREVWGDAATYVPPRDAAALADAINALADDPRRLVRMAEAARSRAARYTARRMAREYHALYSSLAGSGTSDGAREVLACAS